MLKFKTSNTNELFQDNMDTIFYIIVKLLSSAVVAECILEPFF